MFQEDWIKGVTKVDSSIKIWMKNQADLGCYLIVLVQIVLEEATHSFHSEYQKIRSYILEELYVNSDNVDRKPIVSWFMKVKRFKLHRQVGEITFCQFASSLRRSIGNSLQNDLPQLISSACTSANSFLLV